MQIKDKRVIVTGAAGGLGMNISRELLRNGASVSVRLTFINVSKVRIFFPQKNKNTKKKQEKTVQLQ